MQREKQIKFGEQIVTARFPNVRTFINIESRKAQLSDGQYLNMFRSGFIGAHKALDMIDAVANLEAFCGEGLKKIMKDGVDNILDLSVDDFEVIIDIYQNDLKPWIDGWMRVLKEPSSFIDVRKSPSVE